MNRTVCAGLVLMLGAVLPPTPAVAHPPDAGTLETVVSFDAALLEMPESIEADRGRFDLYITNGACSVLGPSNETPSVMRLHLGVPGAPSH